MGRPLMITASDGGGHRQELQTEPHSRLFSSYFLKQLVRYWVPPQLQQTGRKKRSHLKIMLDYAIDPFQNESAFKNSAAMNLGNRPASVPTNY